MLSVEQQLVLAEPRCELLAQKYLSADGQLVCLRDEVYKVCEEFGLMTRPVKHCASVGFHPQNCGENGITPQHVSQKVSLFCHTGFSPFECERAGCAATITKLRAFEPPMALQGSLRP